MTERLHFHFLLSCIGEGNGNPLQCSCLENPRDRGAWWAAVSGILQARTLEWVAISFSNAGKQKVKGKLLSRVRLLATPWTAAYHALLRRALCREREAVELPSAKPRGPEER